MMPENPSCFVLVSRDEQPKDAYEIRRRSCRIGRGRENDICVPDPSVSHVHAILIHTGGRWLLRDQWSTNGIYEDNRRIQQAVIGGLHRLVLGRVRLDVALRREDLDDGGAAVVVLEEKPGDPPPPEEDYGEEGEGAAVPAEVSYREMDALPATVSRRAGSGERGIVCPHCWHRFGIDEFLFIARHQSLVGDPVLGEDAPQRFLPSRFSLEGNALDAMGMSCPDMACPRCHLRIPQAASEMPPLFLSIVGATASGKSYFLTSMTWELRNTLARNFAISFTDTDAINNQIINEFEETVFLNSDSGRLVALRKTELQGELYNQALLDGMLINLPKPFMFTITAAEHHPRYAEVREKTSRTLVLYDNAGEHYEPGMDSVDNPTTQHLLHCDTIFFLFDPTKDVRFRRLIKGRDDPQLALHSRVQRQEIILTEMINRIKKYSGMPTGSRSSKTLMIVVSKCDLWKDLLRIEIPREPWGWDFDGNTGALDVDVIMNVSFAVRSLLDRVCPELVATAESFSGDVVYLPNSALGRSPVQDPETGMIGIHPGDIRPFWGAVPMLCFFHQRGLIPGTTARDAPLVPGRDTEVEYRLSGDVYFVRIPGVARPVQVPVGYGGHPLHYPGTDIRFTLPAVGRDPL